MAYVGQLRVDWVCILPGRYGGSSLSVGVISHRLLLCYGGAPEGKWTGAVWLFTSVRGLRAVAQGVSAPGVPWNFQLLDCDLGCFHPVVGSLSL